MKKKYVKRIAIATITALMTLSLSACGNLHPDDNKINKSNNLTQNIEVMDVETKELDDGFIYATADFSVNIFKESTLEDISSGRNVLISPQSIITAMSMTTNGAQGNTLNQLQDTMYGGMSVNEYNKYMQNYSGRLTASDEVDFYLANSIWIKDDDNLTVNEKFLQTCKSYYDAEVYREAFDEGTTSKINTWVADNTNDMIDTIIDIIPQDAVMYLINATAFEGEWMVQYTDEQILENEIFTNVSGAEENVTMLYSTEEYYLKDEMAQGFMKYYKGGEYAFVAMLPDEEVTMEEYVAGLTGQKLIETYSNREYVDVVVRMPEFTYEYDREMSEDFEALGVTDAFDSGKADFSSMAQSYEGNLFLGRVLHKTFIQNDRNGTKAAAVTSVEVLCESAAEPSRVETVILNRPFFYAIIDCETGLPVFMGVVNTIN